MAEVSAVAVRGGDEVSTSEQLSNRNGAVDTQPARRRFRRNFFIATPATSEAETSGKRNKTEGERSSEWVEFNSATRQEMTTLLDNWVATISETYWKPGGHSILKAQPDAEDMFKLLGGAKGYDSDEQRHESVKGNIKKMLNTPEGWVKARALLDQEAAAGAFVMGLTVAAELADKNVNPNEILADYRSEEPAEGGRIRRFLQRHPRLVGGAGLGAVAGRGVYEVATSATIRHDIYEATRFLVTHIPHTPGELSTYAGGAAGAALGWYLDRRSRNEGQAGGNAGEAFMVARDALLAIKNDPDYAAYVKAVWKVDVNDFHIDEDAQTIEVTDRPKSTAKLSDVLDSVSSNLETRKHYLDDLGVPASDRDIMPELFIFDDAPAHYERTGERYTMDVIEKYHQLQQENIRRPTEAEPSDEDKKKALAVDAQGRALADPLRGRGYPEFFQLPEYNSTRLLKERLDQWGQAKLDPAPMRNELLRVRGSQFYGRTDEASIYLLDNEDIKIVTGEGSPLRSLRERFTRRRSRPDAVLRPKVHKDAAGKDTAELETRVNAAGQQEGIYLYEVRNGNKEVPIAADSIFYIDDKGDRQPLTNVRNFNQTTGTFEYMAGIDRDDVIKNSFFIPPDGSPPLPLSMIDHLATVDAKGNWLNVDNYVCRKGKNATIEVTERVFTGVDRNGDVKRLPQIVSDPATIESFFRDEALQTPLEDAPVYGRIREKYLMDNIHTLLPPGTSLDFNYPLTSKEVYSMLLTGNLPLREGLRLEDIQGYFQGERISPVAQEILNGIFPNKIDVILGEVLPVSDEAFLARDSDGRSPADIRFGISDPAVIAALDALPEIDLTNFDYRTGKDIWGQGPGDPFFCRADREHIAVPPGGMITVNINEEIDLIFIESDQWGQRRTNPDGTPNPFFMRQNAAEVADPQMDLILYRKARELVLSDLTEGLIERMRQTPERTVSIIDTKLAERQNEDGRVINDRREQARKDIPQLEELRSEFEDRKTTLEDYDKATEALKDARETLPIYIMETFGPGITTPEQALGVIRRVRQETGFQLDLTIGGNDISIGSLPARRRQASEAWNEAQEQVRERTLPRLNEPIDAYESRVAALLENDRLRYEAVRQSLGEDERKLLAVKAEIESLQETIKQAQEALAPRGDIAAERHAVIYTRRSDRDQARELIQNAELRNLLLNGSQDDIKNKIHELHASDPHIGWEAADDEDVTKMQLLHYTITLAQAQATDGASLRAFESREDLLNEIILEGVTFGELEELPEAELRRRLSSAISDTQIIEAKQTTINYVETMTRATRSVEEKLGLRIRRLERQAGAVDLGEEIDRLEVTQDIMKRQQVIFNAPALFMAGVDSLLPIEGTDSKSLTALSASEKAEYTDAEKHLDASTPLGYYEVMDVLFGYKDRSDREAYFAKISKYVTPTLLHEIMSESAKSSQLPVEVQQGANLGEFLYSLQENIKKGMVTRRAMRRMLVGVIDTLEARAKAMA